MIFNAYNEIEGCVASIHNLILPVLQETALVLSSAQALSNQFAFQGDSFSDAKAVEILGEPCLALLIDHEDKMDIV